jgi:hypothetical protein
MPNTAIMTDEDMIQRFERDLIPEASFHHTDHVRLVFAYLRKYPAVDALQRFSTALKRFAGARGKPHLYHETITLAYFFLIHERMAESERAECDASDWEEFACENADLLVWKNGILTRYYHDSTLKSDLARKVFVLPDKGLGLPRRVVGS